MKMERDILKKGRVLSRESLPGTHDETTAARLPHICPEPNVGRIGQWLQCLGGQAAEQASARVKCGWSLPPTGHKRTTDLWPGTVTGDLAEHGVRVGIGRIKKYPEELGIRCKQKWRFTTLNRLSVAEKSWATRSTGSTYVPLHEG